ncbi:MAG: tRNA (adenosine(37)-N6)-threonylcarbamoyltransferase complex ATPase subunit type 1 TsaE [Candidatus Paceibacterota bacterium]
MKVISKSLEETEKIAGEFIEKISMGIYNGAVVVGLYGDLGSGKTTFTQCVARLLGIKEDITSPTFVIEKRYQIDNLLFLAGQATLNFKLSTFIHIDAYRLESSKEAKSLGWNEISTNPQNIIFIEWPERILDILPENHIKLNFKFISENEREIEF